MSCLTELNQKALDLWGQGKKQEGAEIVRKMWQSMIPLGSEEREHMKKNYSYYVSFMQWFLPYDSATHRGVGKERLSIIIRGWSKCAPWDPDTTQTGLTGSEEAVVYIGEILASLGHRVIVQINPPNLSFWSLPFGNPLYIPISTHPGDILRVWDKNSEGKADIVVCWRNTAFKEAQDYGHKVCFWPHDIMNYAVNDISHLSGCLFLTHWHRKQILTLNSRMDTLPYVICGNGLKTAHFSASGQQRNNPYACIYASNYSRGLLGLLKIWEGVVLQYPQATLDIYHGRETYGTISKEDMENIDKLLSCLKTKGVTEHGQVGHLALAQAMQRASIWTYPYIGGSETFCITAIKAQYAGLIPVTAKIDALTETVHPSAPSLSEFARGQEEKYRQLLLSIMRDVDAVSEEGRNIYVRFAARFTWEACCDAWLTLFHELRL